VAIAAEERVRSAGAVPATIGIIEGAVRAGLGRT
jgi:pseudouridine-5'-phosphate glycosidase